uniref:Uncharacterized protein n=1 Tax=Oryza sativa subsp. japonica TaxID=39947 RepID=Q6K428_ORYSJ|nr:hypothetical protein [Oryza sativa Japonica Group]BAD22321.1 hypothetical protein [Oryza sativa Japonica Group]
MEPGTAGAAASPSPAAVRAHLIPTPTVEPNTVEPTVSSFTAAARRARNGASTPPTIFTPVPPVTNVERLEEEEEEKRERLTGGTMTDLGQEEDPYDYYYDDPDNLENP